MHEGRAYIALSALRMVDNNLDLLYMLHPEKFLSKVRSIAFMRSSASWIIASSEVLGFE